MHKIIKTTNEREYLLPTHTFITSSFPDTVWLVVQFNAKTRIILPHNRSDFGMIINTHTATNCPVSCGPLTFQLYSLISIRAGACSFIIFGTIDIWAVVEDSVPPADGPASPLVQKVPVETGKGSVLCTFMLYEQGALLSSKFLQISDGV